MFSFNLLPPIYQRQTKWWLLLRHFHHGLLWGTGSAAVIAILLVGAGWYAQQLLDVENKRLQDVLSQPLINQLSTNVHEINQRITTVRSIQQQHTTVVPLLIALYSTLPNTITLTSVDINLDDQRIVLSGIALDRNALKSLQESLQNTPSFEIVQFPFEEFAQASAIPFDIALTVTVNNFQLDDLAL